MVTAATLLSDLNVRLDDPGNTKFTEAQKIVFLNRGQAAMFPKIYRTARDATLALSAGVFEYLIPSAVGANSKIISLEVEGSALDGHYYTLDRYNIIYGLTDPILEISGSALPSAAGANIRITAALPLTPFTVAGDTYTGPAVTEELPILYAMSLGMSADVEQRMKIRRMPTVEGLNGILADDFMTASQFWMQQFEVRLDQFQMPLPVGI